MTTTVWRPRVRIAVPDIDGANVDEKRREESTTKGTKRKRAPPTKGPCEHGVKTRSKCKVCSACPHGRWRIRCKECGGSAICEHGRQRYKCKECGGASICEHGRVRSNARSAVGHQSASTVVGALMQGVRWGDHLRARSSALSVQGVRWVTSASTVVSALSARSAVGHAICEHGRRAL